MNVLSASVNTKMICHLMEFSKELGPVYKNRLYEVDAGR